MSSTHEPVHLLEPSNLLEPFDPEDCHNDLVNLSARLRGDESPPRGRTLARRYGSVRIARDRRSPAREILIIVGAIACFGAAALPQIRNVALGDSAWLAESARRLIDPDVLADRDAYGIKPQAGSIDPKSNPPDPKLRESNAPSHDAPRSADAGASSVTAASERHDTAVNKTLPVASDPLPPSTQATGNPTGRQAAMTIAETGRQRTDVYVQSERAHPLDADAQFLGIAAGIATPIALRVDGATEPP
jgi:hypothetical protein